MLQKQPFVFRITCVCNNLNNETIMKMSFKLILYFLLLQVLPSALFAQQKRLYIAIDDHTDYVWTANRLIKLVNTMFPFHLHQLSW